MALCSCGPIYLWPMLYLPYNVAVYSARKDKALSPITAIAIQARTIWAITMYFPVS